MNKNKTFSVDLLCSLQINQQLDWSDAANYSVNPPHKDNSVLL